MEGIGECKVSVIGILGVFVVFEYEKFGVVCILYGFFL